MSTKGRLEGGEIRRAVKDNMYKFQFSLSRSCTAKLSYDCFSVHNVDKRHTTGSWKFRIHAKTCRNLPRLVLAEAATVCQSIFLEWLLPVYEFCRLGLISQFWARLNYVKGNFWLLTLWYAGTLTYGLVLHVGMILGKSIPGKIWFSRASWIDSFT
jgi:hypothetical protein